MILTNVDRYRVLEPMYEGIRVILRYRGEPYSPAYVQGISGAAFHIGGICPCAPTCTDGIAPVDLARKFGYQAEAAPLFSDERQMDQPASDALLNTVIERVKDEIRANRPVLAFHAFSHCEWDVVSGFDDYRGLFIGRSTNPGLDGYCEANQTRMREAVAVCPAFGAIFIIEKTRLFDAAAAEVASLREAVAHAYSRKNAEALGGESWVFLQGFMAYERWVSDFSDPHKKRTTGDAYCYSVYRSTHRAAAAYLSDLSGKYPRAKKALLEASGHFASEADTLNRGEEWLWWRSPEGPDPARNEKAAALLGQAFTSYRRGIEGIEEALEKIK